MVFILTFIFFVFIVSKKEDELRGVLKSFIRRKSKAEGDKIALFFKLVAVNPENYDLSVEEDVVSLVTISLNRLGKRNGDDTRYEYGNDDKMLLSVFDQDEVDIIAPYRAALDELREAEGTHFAILSFSSFLFQKYLAFSFF